MSLSNFKPPILWAFFIFILCVIPGKSLPKYAWADLLSLDKLIHCFIFFVLVYLTRRAFAKHNQTILIKKQNIIALAFAIPYGGALETMQEYFLSDRNGNWFDFLANTTGAVLGVLLFKKLNRKNK